MPAKKTQSGLMAKLGQRLVTAVETHKNDETKYSGFGDLPAGMSGIAQLVDCRFDVIKPGKTNAGEYMFFARGIVLEPEDFTDAQGNTHHVAGLGTSIMETLCDTPGNAREKLEDHVAWVLNEMRKLGVDTSSAGPDDLESLAEALRQAQPVFRFRTFLPPKATTGKYKDKEPRVQQIWNGAIENYVPGQESEPVQDQTGGTPAANGAAANGAPKAAPAAAPKTTAPVTRPTPAARPAAAAPAPAAPEPAAPTLAELGEIASGEGPEADAAAEELGRLAVEAGFTAQQIKDAPDWPSLAAMIESGAAGAEGGGGDEFVPDVGTVYGFHPIGPNKKPAANPVGVEVVSVDMAAKTCNLKNVSTKRAINNVPWTSLVDAPA